MHRSIRNFIYFTSFVSLYNCLYLRKVRSSFIREYIRVAELVTQRPMRKRKKKEKKKRKENSSNVDLIAIITIISIHPRSFPRRYTIITLTTFELHVKKEWKPSNVPSTSPSHATSNGSKNERKNVKALMKKKKKRKKKERYLASHFPLVSRSIASIHFTSPPNFNFPFTNRYISF